MAFTVTITVASIDRHSTVSSNLMLLHKFSKWETSNTLMICLHSDWACPVRQVLLCNSLFFVAQAIR